MDKTIADKVSSICNAHYNDLPQNGKPSSGFWTNMAAVVMEIENDFTVVAMSTGTKCIGEKERTSWVICDSHAEILCLRLFRRFLVEQISLCLKNADSCLTPANNKKFRLAPKIFFHFYTSCVMCGDSTIAKKDLAFNSNVADTNSMENKALKRSPEASLTKAKYIRSDNRNAFDGMVRTGAKSVMRDDLFKDSLCSRTWDQVGVLRTKPGRGPVCLSLSCSDKLMKRQHLGLQGGLLSDFFAEPIRFKSIIIGGDCSLKSVYRSLFGRLMAASENIASIFKVPDIFIHSQKNSSGKYETANSSSTSLLWLRIGEESIHVVSVKGKHQGATKKSPKEKVMLPVCRRAALKNVISLKESLNGDQSMLNNTDIMDCSEEDFNRLYKNFKIDSQYNNQKTNLQKRFQGWDRKSAKYGQ